MESFVKEVWIRVYEELEEKLGREPTSEETDKAFADRMGDLIDHACDCERDND